MMNCPKCGHEWTDEGRAKGGRASRRTITPEQQARMQAARGQDAPEKKIKKDDCRG